MGGLSISRNAPCPCGSGRKYKRCCLADEQRAVREARFDDAVGSRLQDWSSKLLGDEITAAIGDLATEPMRRWLDEPHQLLDGRTPREAVAGADRMEVVRLLPQIENGAERAHRSGQAADVSRLRDELGLDDELAA